MADDDSLGVVFVHGFISSPAVWDGFYQRIADDPELRFVAPLSFQYDTRFWQPRLWRRIPTFDTIADSLKGFLETDAAGFRSLVLVAHSQGGLIVQRHLARMLGRGRGQDLSRIRRIVLFACPNNGAQVGLTLRRGLLRSNPQERQLRPLDDQITETHGIVINQIVHARTITASTCPIPIAVYVGETDNIVTPASARSVFPDVAVLPGDHFSIVKPDTHNHRSYTALKQQLLAAGDSGPPVETIETVGPETLEIHSAAPAGDSASRPTSLTPYLPRDHDAHLQEALTPALDGDTSILVMVTGGSSTGKTRALYETLRTLAPTRPVLRPVNIDELLKLINDDRVSSGVVLWLNEAQRFLDGSAGEQAAAKLRSLLEQQPGVVAVGTLWTEPYWNQLTTQGEPEDRHSQARALLTNPRMAVRIHVPDELSESEKECWLALGQRHHDLRMHEALDAGANDGRVVQHLSGGPELLGSYLRGPGAHFNYMEHALLTAALDARRLGHLAPLPAALITEAADGALDPRHHMAERDWGDRALSALSSGTRQDGIRIDVRRTLTPLIALRSHSGEPPFYRPDDYLDQHTRERRADQLGTPSLWDALTTHTSDADDLDRLFRASRGRGLYKQAIRLARRAVLAGHTGTPSELIRWLGRLFDPHRSAAQWTAAHTNLTAPAQVAHLLEALREAGADQAVKTLMNRQPSNQVDITAAQGIAYLLRVLRRHGAVEAIEVLLNRDPAAKADLSGRGPGLVQLLEVLQEADAHEAVATLARRITIEVELTDESKVVQLLKALRNAGEQRAVETLAHRTATHVSLGDLLESIGAISESDVPVHAPELLRELEAVGASEAVNILASRAVAEVDLSETEELTYLLKALRDVRADQAVQALLNRDPADHADLTHADEVAGLLAALRGVGADEAADTLSRRAVAHVELTNPTKVAALLRACGQVHEDRTMEMLLGRDPVAHVDFNDTYGLALLLGEMRRAGVSLRRADVTLAVESLTHRSAAQADPTDRTAVVELLKELRRADEGQAANVLALRAAAQVDLTNPGTAADWLWTLGNAGADRAVEALLERDPAAHVNLTDALDVGRLLGTLRHFAADRAVETLLARDPAAHVNLTDADNVAHLLGRLREIGADRAVEALLERDPAAHVSLTDTTGVARLLDALWKVGADEAAAALARRIATHVNLTDATEGASLLKAMRVVEEAVAHAFARRSVVHAELANTEQITHLLAVLLEAGADQAIEELLDRNPATHAALTSRRQVRYLIDVLHEANADGAAETLARRAMDAGIEPDGLPTYGRETDGRCVAPWTWDDVPCPG